MCCQLRSQLWGESDGYYNQQNILNTTKSSKTKATFGAYKPPSYREGEREVILDANNLLNS